MINDASSIYSIIYIELLYTKRISFQIPHLPFRLLSMCKISIVHRAVVLGVTRRSGI